MATCRWQAPRASASNDPDNDADLSVDYVLGSASPTMISLWLLIYDYGHGAHGTASDEGITWLLGEGRALRADDVFDANKAWGEALARLVLEQAKREIGDTFRVPEPSEIVAEVSDPVHWLISERALDIRFVIDGAPSCCGTVDETIPWSKVKPYLRSPLPFSVAPN